MQLICQGSNPQLELTSFVRAFLSVICSCSAALNFSILSNEADTSPYGPGQPFNSRVDTSRAHVQLQHA